ncbi:T9SS type A sorting domain-containing protein, partial [candidate division KSB1 bacterium]|nr:T9SS type A sorting domain-containing protein [candidate division KSB1 bacterium]
GYHYIVVLAAGAGCNLGRTTMVRINSGSSSQMRQSQGGLSSPVHFGIGPGTSVDKITLTTAAGVSIDEVNAVPGNSIVLLGKEKLLKPLWLRLNKTTANSGDSVLVSGQIQAMNIPRSFTDSLYLSLDQNAGPNDIGVDTLVTIPKQSGKIYNSLSQALNAITCNFSKNITLPHVADGRYWMLLNADADDQIQECSETNNIISSPAQIEIAKTAADLTCGISSALPQHLAIGEQLAFACEIRNTGGDSVRAPFTAAFYLSHDGVYGNDTLLTAVDVQQIIPPGNSMVINLSAAVPVIGSGFHHLFASVDSADVILESDETNNISPAADSVRIDGIKVGRLNLSSDRIHPLTDHSAEVSGHTAVNGYLELGGLFVIDLTDSILSSTTGNSSLYVAGLVNVPDWIPTTLFNGDTLFIYTGAIEMDLSSGGARIDFDPAVGLPFKLGLFDIRLKTIGASQDRLLLGLTVAFPSEIGGSLDLDSLKIIKGDGIEAAGKIELPDPLDLKGIAVKSAWVAFNTEENSYAGGGTAGVPDIADISFEIYLSSGKIDSFSILYEPEKEIPINSTGLSITKVGGQIKNISPPRSNPVTVIVSAGIVAGPEIISGLYAVEADPITVTIKPNFFEAEASSILVLDQATGQAKLTYDHLVRTLKCSTVIDFLHVLTGNLQASLNGISLNRTPSFNGSIQGSLVLPDVDKFPLNYISDFVGLPKTLGGIHATANNDRAEGTFYLTLMPSYRQCMKKCWWSPRSGWHRCCITIPELGFDGAFRLIYSGGQLQFYIGENFQSLTKILPLAGDMALAHSSAAAFQRRIKVPANRPQLIIKLTGSPGAPPAYDLTTPYGFTLTPEDTFAVADDIMLVHHWTQPQKGCAYYHVLEPMEGDWIVACDQSDVELQVFCQNNPPFIKMLQPVGAGQAVQIKWLDSDVDDDAVVALFYDTDQFGCDGSPIPFAGDISEDDAADAFTWYPENVPTGDYFVYAMIADSVNAPVFCYCPQPIHIEHPAAPAVPAGLKAAAQDTLICLSWNMNTEPNLWGYMVHYTDDLSAGSYRSAVATGDTTAFDLVDVEPGRKYRIALTAYNRLGVISEYSCPVTVELRNTQGNNAPFISSKPPLTVVENETYCYQIKAQDADGDGLSYTLLGGPAGMTLSTDGCLQWSADSPGLHRVEVSVSDSHNGIDTQSFDLQVASALLKNGRVLLDSRYYDAAHATAMVMVKDVDKNLSTTVLDNVTVWVKSTVDTVGISVDCRETSAHSGVFVGHFTCREAQPSDDSNDLLGVANPDTVHVFYYDEETFGGAALMKWDVAVWSPLPVKVEDPGGETGVVPLRFELTQNAPNPFNTETCIHFALPQNSRVNLRVYNVNGQVIKRLVEKEMPAGRHVVSWDGRNEGGEAVASGVYFCKMEAGAFIAVRRMVVVR